MGDYRETQEWRDIPHRDKSEEIVVRFVIEYQDAQKRQISSVFAEIFRAADPSEIYRIGYLRFDQNIKFHHVFAHVHTVHGWLRWRTGLHVSYSQQVVGRLETGEPGDLDYWNYDGFMIGFGSVPALPPPDVPKPEPDPDIPLPFPDVVEALAIPETQLEKTELFPFVYIRPWPKLPTGVVAQRFMSVPADVASTDFYKTLAQSDGQTKRLEAVTFINDTISPAPDSVYTGQFLVPIQPLPSPFSEFLRFPSDLRLECTIGGLSRWVHEEFETWQELATALQTPAAQETLVSIWNSAIAMMITAGYDPAWLSTLVRLLQVTHLVDCVLALQGHDADQEVTPALPDSQLTRMIQAVMVLPDDIFPVFPLPKQPEPPTIQPYAVGAIRTVYYTPERYTLGDVQRIEILTAGETRQEVRRNLRYSDTSGEERSDAETSTTSTWDTTTADLVDQVNKTLSDRKSATTVKNYQTDYGAPTTNSMTVTGNWWVEDKPAGGYAKDISKFARNVVERSVKALRQDTVQRRKLRVHEEAEITQTRTLSNLETNGDRQTVFRWVNRQFRLQTKASEDRLVFVMFVDTPGKNLLQTVFRQYDMDVAAPVSPQTLGIMSYKDLSPEVRSPVVTSPSVYYLDAFEVYGIAPDDRAPPATLSLATGMTSRSPVCDTCLDVPPGYFALNATATVACSCTPSQIQVTLGGVDLAAVQTGTVSMFKGDLSAVQARYASQLWASVLCCPQPATPPSQTTTPAAEASAQCTDDADIFYAVTLQVQCVRSPSTLAGWQMETYQRIQAAYRQALAQYHARLSERGKSIEARNPRLLSDLVQDRIIRSAIALFASATCPQAEDADMAREFEPRYAQFLRNAFDWEGMAVELMPPVDGANLYLEDGESALLSLFSSADYFLDFLHARQARLMLSVKPDFARSLLMTFRTGELWPCEEDIAPCVGADMNIVDLLLEQRAAPSRKAEDCWTITVPTDMVALSAQDPFSSHGRA